MKKLLFFASAVAMLASCSQDLTEDVVAPAPSFEGNSSIIASYNMGDETRTSLSDRVGNVKPYVWDEADALGVFADAVDDKTNATFKFIKMLGENSAEFKGSYEFIETEEYIVYYPYNPAGYNTGSGSAMEALSVLDGKKVRLSIPATQLFNFEANAAQSGDYAGSFSQNTAPSIGTGAIEDGKLVVNMKGAATYIFFPIKGTGAIKTLELSISGEDHLNGYNQVVADIEDPDFGFKAPTKKDNGSATTILNCGVKGVTLDTEKATNFWFVVPNLTLKDATITVKVNGNEDLKLVRTGYTSATATGAWYPNITYRIFDVDANGTANTPWYIDVPADDDDDFIIDNEYKFLEYAYAATVGKDIPTVMLKKDGTNLKTGKITVPELNFEGFTFAAEGSAFRKAVAAWYNAAEGVIPTIGGAKAFSIVGAVKPEVAAAAEEAGEAETPATVAPATIKGLKFDGAVFNDGNAKKLDNTVENIVLSGVETKGAYILTNRVYNANGKFTFKNVTIDATCTADEGAAVIGRAFTDYLEFNEVHNQTDHILINELNIMGDFDFTTEENSAIKFNYPVVHQNNNPSDGKIVTVADAKAAADFIEAANKAESQYKAKWYSVKAGDTFYYTGTAATALRADDVITAEEFAFLTTKEGIATVTDNTYTLTNSIDMMGAEIEATAETATVTVEEGANVTISNVKVASAFLLAETGTATGVNVEATYTATGYVGGLFFEADVEDAGKTTACVVTADAAAAEKFGTYYAKVYITLGTENTLTLSADFVDDNAPYGAIVCKAPQGGIEGEYTNVYFKDGYSKEQLEAIADRIEWEWAEDAQIPDGYYLQMISGNTTVKSEKFEFKVTNDDALKYAIENAEEGDTVKVEPGTYGKLPKPTAEGVIIDATGATFDGVVDMNSNIDLNGGELIGATFTGNQFANGAKAGTINGTFTNCKFIGGKTSDDDGIYGYSASADVVFDGCEFTAGDTVAQVLATNGTVTYKGCTFNGFVSASGNMGTTFDGCTFNVGAAGFAGGNFWAKTTVKDTTFNFVQYDAEKSATDANYYNWISLVKQDDVEAYNFTGCKVLNSEGAVVAMPANYVFQIATKNAGTVVNIDGVQITLKATVKAGASK